MIARPSHSSARSLPAGLTARRGFVLACLAVILATTSTGCVYRRMTVRSDPPGARVFVDGQDIGFTPCAVDFTYYGTREIMLVKDGYETLTVLQKVPAPWYQYPVIEFFADNLWPQKVTDRHCFNSVSYTHLTLPTILLV